MGASKDFPITGHSYVPCGCGDPECRYCAECMEQECFHQPAAPSGLRDVPLDEVFTWAKRSPGRGFHLERCLHLDEVFTWKEDFTWKEVPTWGEVLTWKEDFLDKAREAFNGLTADVSPATYSDLKSRCEEIDRELDPFFERIHSSAASFTFKPGLRIHMVKQNTIPDGVLRRCSCMERSLAEMAVPQSVRDAREIKAHNARCEEFLAADRKKKESPTDDQS
jgi:hypothetical protein